MSCAIRETLLGNIWFEKNSASDKFLQSFLLVRPRELGIWNYELWTRQLPAVPYPRQLRLNQELASVSALLLGQEEYPA